MKEMISEFNRVRTDEWARGDNYIVARVLRAMHRANENPDIMEKRNEEA